MPPDGSSRSWPRILMVAYEFPPRGGAGVQRPAKMTKDRLRPGAAVAVLRGPVNPRFTDPSLSAGIPDEIRVRAPDPGPLRPVQNLRARFRPRGIPDRLLVALSAAIQAFCIPDANNAWLLTGVWRGLGLARRFQPDVIVATGPRFTSFLVAALVSRLSGTPLVLDYRDPWSATYLPSNSTGLRGFLNPWLERWALRGALGVVAAHRSVFDYLRETRIGFPAPDQRRMWVPNGYDAEDFGEVAPAGEKRFVLTYTGHYGFRDPRVLLEVLEELLADGTIDPERFRFRLAGDLKQVQSHCKPGPTLSRVLRMEGYLSHPDSVRCLQESTVNLVLEVTSGGRNMHSPGKVFEVPLARRPVLLICPEGTTPALARRAGGCFVNDPSDRAGIRNSLRTMYETWSAAGRALPAPDPDRIRFYDRGFQSLRMLSFLGAIVPQGLVARQSRATAEARPRVTPG